MNIHQSTKTALTPWVDRPTPVRYYQGGVDVTWYVMNGLSLPHSQRFFEVEVREVALETV